MTPINWWRLWFARLNWLPCLCRDPDDDKVIAAAIYGLADYILTIDNDLLTKDIKEKLGQAGVKILNSDDFIRLLDQR